MYVLIREKQASGDFILTFNGSVHGLRIWMCVPRGGEGFGCISQMDASDTVRGRWLEDSIHLVLVGARLYGSLRPLVAGKQRSHYSLSGPESGEPKPDVSKYPSSLLHTQTNTDIFAYRYRRLQVQTAQTMTPISVHDKTLGLPACKRLNVWRQASGSSKPRIQNWGRVSAELSSIPTDQPSSKVFQPATVAVSSSLDQAA